MIEISLILLVPVLIAFCSLLFSEVRTLSRAISIAVWLYLGLLIYLLFPLFVGQRLGFDTSTGLETDKLSASFILLTAFVTASALSHAQLFFKRELASSQPPQESYIRQFYFLSILLMAAMVAVYLCNNLGFLWMSLEATTLLSAGLVYFQRTKHALEATWKFFIICSVGIAFALLGTILIFASSQYALPEGSLSIPDLVRVAQSLNVPLFKLGFTFAFLGYATKAGVFPLHSWLPDAHSQAPSPTSAMLSGSQLNCALFAIWKLFEISNATQHFPLAKQIVIWSGSITVVVASVFLVRQYGIKRLWAYSSIENVGLLLVAVALGSAPIFFLQSLNHSLAKVSLFLLAGNIIQSTGTKQLREIRGLLRASPACGILLALSAMAVTGAPPFGAFISEWMILSASMDIHQFVPASLLVFGLALSFIAVAVHISDMLLGTPKNSYHSFNTTAINAVPALLLSCSFLLGFLISPNLLSVPLP